MAPAPSPPAGGGRRCRPPSRGSSAPRRREITGPPQPRPAPAGRRPITGPAAKSRQHDSELDRPTHDFRVHRGVWRRNGAVQQGPPAGGKRGRFVTTSCLRAVRHKQHPVMGHSWPWRRRPYRVRRGTALDRGGVRARRQRGLACRVKRATRWIARSTRLRALVRKRDQTAHAKTLRAPRCRSPTRGARHRGPYGLMPEGRSSRSARLLPRRIFDRYRKSGAGSARRSYRDEHLRFLLSRARVGVVSRHDGPPLRENRVYELIAESMGLGQAEYRISRKVSAGSRQESAGRPARRCSPRGSRDVAGRGLPMPGHLAANFENSTARPDRPRPHPERGPNSGGNAQSV